MDYIFLFYIGVFIFATSESTVYKTTSVVQPCETLNSSGVKRVEHFASSFFIDSCD